MKKLILSIAAILAETSLAFSQGVGIGETGFTPDPSSMLEVQSASKGVLIPRMTETQRNNIASPATGLLVYQTNGSPGYYFYNGSSWLLVSTASLPSGVSGQTLRYDGTAWVANSQLFNDGTNVGIGTTTPAYKLELSGADASFNGVKVGKGAGNRLTNTTVGMNAMNANTTGDFNTAIGYNVMLNNTTGLYNTGLGYFALLNLTKGTGNIAIGHRALNYDTTGSYNTAVGYGPLYNNRSGIHNTALGYRPLYSNTTGYSNVAVGTGALYLSADRNNLVAVGDSALYNNGGGLTGGTKASANTAVGSKSLFSNITGSYNTSIGYQSLYSNTSGNNNTALGYLALYSNSLGHYNTAEGTSALYSNTEGDNNTANGYQALHSNTSGNSNTANGFATMSANTTGNFNTACGTGALELNISGGHNTAIGTSSLLNNETGVDNTAIGSLSLKNNQNGHCNTAVGAFAYYDGSFTDWDNSTALGYYATITGSNQVRIGNMDVTSIGGYSGWTILSDMRFNKEVKENVSGLAFILKLRPVTYHLDLHTIAYFNHIPDSLRLKNAEALKENILQTGFIAQEVEVAANELGFDFSGIDKPQNENDFYGLRYAEFVVPLVKAVQEQQLMIESQQKQIDELKSLVRELISQK